MLCDRLDRLVHLAEGMKPGTKGRQHWQSKAPGLQAGDHYAMVDDFADIVGLSGRFEWLADPFTANGAPPPSAA